MLELGNLRAMTSCWVIGEYFPGEPDVDPSLTWTTVLYFVVSFRSLVLPLQLFSLLVLYVF